MSIHCLHLYRVEAFLFSALKVVLSTIRAVQWPMLSFLNGHLHVEYVRLSGWLGFPPCSSTQWHWILQKLEIHVTKQNGPKNGYIITHHTCTCIVQIKKNGDSHLAGKKLGMEDLYLHMLGTRQEGWKNLFIILCITLIGGAHTAFPDATNQFTNGSSKSHNNNSFVKLVCEFNFGAWPYALIYIAYGWSIYGLDFWLRQVWHNYHNIGKVINAV